MPIEYDVYQTPSPTNSEEANFHVRIVPKETITSDKFAKEIEYGSSLTVGDIDAALSSISQMVATHLSRGNRVHIEGLGYLQLAITAPTLSDPSKMRADHIRVKGINFQPDKKLLDKIKKIEFKRVSNKRHSANLSDDEVKAIIANHLQNSSFITRQEFQHLCNSTKTLTINRLNALIANKTIKKEGNRNSPVYVKGENWED